MALNWRKLTQLSGEQDFTIERVRTRAAWWGGSAISFSARDPYYAPPICVRLTPGPDVP